jgi:hypothetical protein
MHKDVRPATADDAAFIAAHLKQSDRDEVLALYGEVERPIMLAYSMSQKVHTWVIDGEPAAIFGVTPDHENSFGYIWSLSTPKVHSKWREVHRTMPIILDYLSEGFDAIGNIKDIRNTTSIRWLRSLGFTFINTFTSPDGLVLHEFVRITK